ncbi:MAG: ester cyclase [bacterium]|nr:ester cyclase [bacterium]
MSEQNKQVVRKYVEAFNRGDLDGVCATFAPDAIVYGVLGSGGLDIARSIWQELITANGMQLHIEAMSAEGDTVAVRYTERGKSIGSFRGLPVTGKTYEIVAMEWFEIRGGKTQKRWGARDAMTIAKQLGLPLSA